MVQDGFPQQIFAPYNYNLTLLYDRSDSGFTQSVSNDPFYVSTISLNSYQYMYMSRGQVSKRPSHAVHEWSVSSFNFDSFYVGQGDSTVTNDLEYYVTIHAPFNNIMYVSATSFSNYMSLVPGTPVNAYIFDNVPGFFKYCVYGTGTGSGSGGGMNRRIMIKTMMTSHTTNPNIYVIKSSVDDPHPLYPPSLHNRQWSRDDISTDPLVINDMTGDGCYYFALLHRGSEATIQVMVTDSGITKLTDGMTQPDVVEPGSSNTYVFPLTHATKELQIIAHTVCCFVLYWWCVCSSLLR